jgi:hypothetical protein
MGTYDGDHGKGMKSASSTIWLSAARRLLRSLATLDIDAHGGAV